MMKKWMMAGLMGATILSAIAPAQAQNDRRDWNRGDQAQRVDGGRRFGRSEEHTSELQSH